MQYQAGLIGLTLLSLASNAMALDSDSQIHVIIKYKQTHSLTSLKKQLGQTLNLPVKSMAPMAGEAYTLVVSGKELAGSTLAGMDKTEWVLNKLRQNPNVQFAVEDRVGHFKPMPVIPDTEFMPPLSHDLQWDEFTAPGGVMLESSPGKRDGAWAYTTGQASSPIVVAVLDTGIAMNPGITGNLLKDAKGNVLGWNFAANNNDLSDETLSFHGTHVAGTIAAYSNVMIGVGEYLKILPVKVPDGTGMFYESQVINAIYWSVGGDVPGVPRNPYPAKVLNMSFGVDERPGKEIDHCDEALQAAVCYARGKGAVLAAAAGNDNRWEHFNAPAVCNGTMKVASTGPEGLRAFYSNYGPTVTYAAPGGDTRYGKQGAILSTVNPGGGYQGSGYDFYQGTSMASPHAAGVAALVYAAVDGYIKPERVEQILYATTHNFGESNDPNKSCVGNKPCGHGILDANNAVKTAIAEYDEIFSAPKIEVLALQNCSADSVIPQGKQLNADKAFWKLVHADCQSQAQYQQIHIEQKQDKIYAYYGATVYELDTSAYKQCQVIGFDGVGCYY